MVCVRGPNSNRILLYGCIADSDSVLLRMACRSRFGGRAHVENIKYMYRYYVYHLVETTFSRRKRKYTHKNIEQKPSVSIIYIIIIH